MMFAQEPLATMIEDAKPLFRAQWAEAGEDGDVMPFDPAYDLYIAAESAGRLRAFTVRDHGALVGHAVYFLVNGMHSRQTRGAISDQMWIRPEYRGRNTAWRLLRFVETWLREDGVVVMHTQSNDNFPGFARLLEYMGHRTVGRIHSKVLAHA